MKKLCTLCKYKYEPKSISDYEEKAREFPNLINWGKEKKKNFYYLCSCPDIADFDGTNGSCVFKLCRLFNPNGNCNFYKQENCIDIIPEELELYCEKDILDVGDTLKLEIKPLSETKNKYKYEWYENGRRLWNENSSIFEFVLLDSSLNKPITKDFACRVIQYIDNNGDGGIKEYYQTYKKEITLNVKSQNTTAITENITETTQNDTL